MQHGWMREPRAPTGRKLNANNPGLRAAPLHRAFIARPSGAENVVFVRGFTCDAIMGMVIISITGTALWRQKAAACGYTGYPPVTPPAFRRPAC